MDTLHDIDMVYLIVKNLEAIIDSSIIPLINARGNCGKVINEGDKWQDLKDGFQMRVGEAGRGELIIKFKEGVEYWVLPFKEHPSMIVGSDENGEPIYYNNEDAFVLDKASYVSYGWDVIEEEL